MVVAAEVVPMQRMKRRGFIALFGSVAAAWPIAVRAQQDGSIPRIGVLWPGGGPPPSPRMESFRKGLRRSGYIENQNVAIELRYAQAGFQQLADLAADLVLTKVDVIAVFGDLPTKIVQQATDTIPIVSLSDDLLGSGVIGSLSRPGGNTTGITILAPDFLQSDWSCCQRCCRDYLALLPCGIRLPPPLRLRCLRTQLAQ